MAKTGMTEEILPGEAGFSAEGVASDETFPLEASDPEATGAAARQTAATPTADSPTSGALQNVATFFCAWDHLGTVRLVSNQDRSVLDRHDYEPFGVELTPFTDQADLTHRFTGHERDLQTGYDYMHYRFYGSTLGRFLKPDLVVANAADPQSWNLYAYVRNNPIAYNDPYGLWYMSPSNSLRTMDHGLPGPSWDFLNAEAMGPEDDAFFDPNNRALKEISLMESNWEVWSTPMGSSGAWIYHPGTTTTTQTGPITMNGISYLGSNEVTVTAGYWEYTPILPVAEKRGSGSDHSLLSHGSKTEMRIGGAVEMVIGAETMELGGVLIESGSGMAAGAIATVETGAGPVLLGTAGAAEILVGVSMVVGGGWLIYDGGVRVFAP